MGSSCPFMSQNLKTRVLKSKTVAASRGGGMGALSEALSPLPPSQKEKMAKTSYF